MSERQRAERGGPTSVPPPAGHRVASDMLTDLFRYPLDPGYAEAARRRAQSGPPSRPSRLSAGWSRAVALALVGFLLAVAYQQVVARAPGENQTRADLAADVTGRRAEADRLQDDADRLREAVSRRRDEALATEPELSRLRDLEARTGLGRVRGNGAVVTLSDAPTAVDPVTGRAAGANPGRVLDRDLQDVVNGLWQAGAEAIAINGQRLTATSTIRTAGGAILVDYRPVARPYQVAAIGAAGLDRRLLNSATGKRFRRFADTYRMRFEVKARDGLELAAGTDPGLRYARPPQPSDRPPGAVPSGSASPSGGGR